MAQKKLPTLIIFLFLGLLFLYLTYNPTMSTLFFSLLILYVILWFDDPDITYKLQARANWGKSILLAIGGYVSLILGSLIILPLLKITGAMSLTDAWNTITSTQSTIFSNYASPILAENPLIYIIVIALLVPIIETTAFVRLMETFKDRWNIKVSLTDLKTFLLFAFISSLFMFLHLTSKLAEGTTAFAIVFLFMFISLILVIIEGQMTSAIILHVGANLIAVWKSAATAIPWTIVLYIGIGAVVLYLIKFKPIRELVRG